MIANQPNINDKDSLNEFIAFSQQRLKVMLAPYWNNIPSFELKEAMQYTMANSGKLLRPLLIYASGLTFGAAWEDLDVPAAAVELIHTYSLIHDDLPCMDNADLRRGQPACHKVYGEAIAVLTGDALHTLAMQIIANHPASLTANQRISMIQSLSIACGPYGMAAGQALDLIALSNNKITTSLLEEIYRLKTGVLFTACLELGRLAAPRHQENDQQAIKTFGELIGLAFQIQDDILDIEASSEQLGKPQGIDCINNKLTYPRLHGLAAAKKRVGLLYDEALSAIAYLGDSANLLRQLAKFMLQRTY